MAKESAEPQEWQRGEADARAARVRVAEQVTEELLERGMTGSEETFALRLRELAEARRIGDRDLLRAAVMELTVSGAAWCVELDLRWSR